MAKKQKAPPPPKRGRPPKYPWDEVDVDEFFYLKATMRSAVSMCARATRQRPGKKFTAGFDSRNRILAWRHK